MSQNNDDSEIYHVFKSDTKKIIKSIDSNILINALKDMLLARNFEQRAESAYQSGKISGFLHLYIGQEAVATGCVYAAGADNYYTSTYRNHALALLLGATPDEMMAELYGKATGNVLGRGGSMHLFLENMLGGLAIVGGHIPIATGAGFSIKYKNNENKNYEKVSVCTLGDGTVPQGAFHESLNLASLWDLPVIYVVENNRWAMGTPAEKEVCVKPIAEKIAPSYNMKSYTLDGMDFFNCYAGFKDAAEYVKKEKRPVLIEALTFRFKGHSISDPGLYRSKERVLDIQKQDPIIHLKEKLIEHKIITEEDFINFNEEKKQIAIKSMTYAEDSPWPDPTVLGEGVFCSDNNGEKK
jgi:pyruvate dehydrogenase E1 component alpha subunit